MALLAIVVVIGSGLGVGPIASRPADARASRPDLTRPRQDAADRGPSKQELQKGFNRRYAKCLRRSSADAALGLMGFVSRYRSRLNLHRISAKVKRCAKFELRFDTQITASATEPGATQRGKQTLHAVVPLRVRIDVASNTFLFSGSGRFDFKQYSYSGSNVDGCTGRAGGTKGTTFRVKVGEIYTNPLADGFGDVTLLVFDPGTPLNSFTWTCPGFGASHSTEPVWRNVWEMNHEDELLSPSTWRLRELERHTRRNPGQVLISHSWHFFVVRPEDSSTETTILAIVRVT